jgi:hypothetical protein
MEYSITSEKWAAAVAAATRLHSLATAGHPVPVRDLAAILGRLNSFRRSHGQIVQVLTRHLQHNLGLHVNVFGWSGFVRLDGLAVRELSSVISDLPFFMGRLLPAATLPLVVPAFSPPRSPPLPIDNTPEPAAFQLLVDGSLRHVAAAPSPRAVLPELSAAADFLSNNVRSQPRLVYWHTTSRMFCQVIKHGSLVHEVNTAVVDILRREMVAAATLIPVWSPTARSDIAFADHAFSLSLSTDEWSVARPDLHNVFAALHFQPDVDCFASRTNTVCEKFFSLTPQSHALGVDFFAQALLPGVRYFFCPPVKLLAPAFRRCLQFKNITALLIFPDWTSTAFWVAFHPLGRLHPVVTDHVDFKPPFFTTTPAPSLFASGAAVPMRAILIHT